MSNYAAVSDRWLGDGRITVWGVVNVPESVRVCCVRWRHQGVCVETPLHRCAVYL